MSNRTISYDDLKQEIEKYLSSDEIKEVEKAYKFAYDKHKGQYR